MSEVSMSYIRFSYVVDDVMSAGGKSVAGAQCCRTAWGLKNMEHQTPTPAALHAVYYNSGFPCSVSLPLTITIYLV